MKGELVGQALLSQHSHCRSAKVRRQLVDPSWIQDDGMMGLRVRSLALQIRQSPETGHEELVVVGGYYTSVLAEMKPFTLDLETLVWHCWEGVEPVPTEASGPSQSAAAIAMPKLPGLPEPPPAHGCPAHLSRLAPHQRRQPCVGAHCVSWP